MRTFDDIYEDFCKWLMKRANSNMYSYNALKQKYGVVEAKGLLYKQILSNLYNPDHGLYMFCKFILGDLMYVGYPKPYKYNSVLRQWDKIVRRDKYAAILAARGLGKTMWFSIVLNLYDMLLHPYRRILISSSSQEQAIRILSDFATIVENNEWLSQHRDLNKWSAEKLGYNKGYIIGKGIGSEVLGEHLDRIVCDDILRSDNKLTDAQIEDYIDLNLMPMLLSRDGQMLIVGCVNENTWVITEAGIRQIKQFKTTQDKLEPISLRVCGLDGLNLATDVFDNGVKDTIIINTELGYNLECTPNHPVLVKNKKGKYNWKKSKKLKVGDEVCLQYNQNVFPNESKIVAGRDELGNKFIKLDYHIAYTIGLYLSEGFVLNNKRITINDMLGLKKELILEMLRGYSTSNGLISGKAIIFEDTVKENILGIQTLLLNLGILTRFGKYRKTFRLEILPEYLLKFYDIIVYGKEYTDTNIKVKPIKITKLDKGKSHTYDFIIPNTHSFCSNGIISHNTPKSPTDIFSVINNRLKENPDYSFKMYKFPAIIDENKKILQCPERFTWESLMQKRETMGPLKFAREYQLEFFSRDQSLFPKSLVQRAMEKGKDYGICYEKPKDLGPQWQILIGVDVARSGSASADYSVAMVLAYNPNTQEKRFLYMWRKKGLKISEQAYQLAELSHKFGNPMFIVEKNNIGQDLIDELIDNYNLYVDVFTTGGVGQRKDELIRFAVQSFEREQIIIPNKDEEAREMFRPFIDELERFCVTYTPAGNEQYRGLGGHDDTVMAASLSIKATQTTGVPFAITKNSGSNSSVTTPIIGRDRYESDLVNQIRSGFYK